MFELKSVSSKINHIPCTNHNGNDYVVYEHINPKTNVVFYVGYGTLARAYSIYSSSAGRPEEWRKIVTSYGCVVNIVKPNLSKEEAKELEATLIDKYKRIIDGGTLVNIATFNNKRPSGELGREILMFDCFGRIIKEFSNANNVPKEYGRFGDIYECLKEPIINGVINKTTGKGRYLWRYKDEYNPSIKFTSKLSGTGGVTPIIRVSVTNGFTIHKVYVSANYVENEFVKKTVSNVSTMYGKDKKLIKHKGYYFFKFVDLPLHLKKEVLEKHEIVGY